MERLRNEIGSSEVVEVRNSRKLLHPCAGGKGNALEAHSLVLNGRNWIHGEDATVAEKLPRERERERNILVILSSPSLWSNLAESS